MAEIINLRRARKARDRAAAVAAADANRLAHGRTRTEQQATAAEQSRQAKLLDEAKRESSNSNDE